MTRKNKLIEAFGDKYLTIAHNGGYCLYDKERKTMRSNFSYMGKFYLSTDKTKYVYNDDTYSSIEELVSAMDEYNKTLPFSPGNYDPNFRKHIMVEYCLDDYLRELGFETSWGHDTVYELKDGYGLTMCALMIEFKEDTTTGKILRLLGSKTENSSSWVESSFTDIDSAIGSVNTIISSCCAVIGSISTSVLDKMTKSRSSEIYNKTFDLRTLKTYVEDGKAKMIERLERELKLLKGGD